MTKHRSNSQLYLQQYPHLRKWINQCVVCQREGYMPEMPEDIHPGVAAQNLRKYFDELEVNEVSICDLCENALGDNKLHL